MKKLFLAGLLVGIFIVLSVMYFTLPSDADGIVNLRITVLGDERSSEQVEAADFLQGHEFTTTFAPKMIKCLDEVCANQNYYWKTYINDEYVTFGIDQLPLEDGDIVELRYG
ncbi:MAG: DUF4430 domain-containing protein [Nanoarchaeota archaeon]|nr:DUF4430 domain-containing protein [Nanoarchaeota archaeon]